MPRPANPETRSRLLEKGGDLVSTLGFNATGVQEITAVAGVPKGSFYNYFESKEAFAAEVLTEYWDSVVATYGSILADHDMAPLARITRYFAGLAEFHERRRYAVGCLIGNMALEVTPSSELVRMKLAAIYRQWAASLTECLQEAQAQGELPAGKDPEQVAVALIDAFEGAVTRAKVERNRSPFDSFEGFVLPALVT
ncbi:TetR family transcriptional regulator C-terminal domain-containing protein [Rhizobium sp. R693]|uniref:TetR/AcrR family transcriptional regulator n=1 Tax=Rhizobium sp. R693 TaxID=1764276 RepID=UPI000B52F104|nr:TetR family transcriptional regulator C-terminal domain-containing protein [Rhizobium sp. R693]OWV97992.1 TetR family transcriptional regulator [Rhizobium sp. R693]